MKRLSLILSFLLLTLGLWAQTTKVRGIVRDAATGEPVPFVSVYFEGTTIGISTDLDGRYSIETRSPNAKVLTASMIGYVPQSFVIVNGSFSEVNFRLKEDVSQLDAAYVKPDNRYIKSILRKLDKARDGNNPYNGENWEASLYTRIELDATNLEELVNTGFIKKEIGFVKEYADTSAVTGKPYIPIMLSENSSTLYHSSSPKLHREVMHASRVSGFEDDNPLRQYTGSYLLSTNFYDSSVSVFNLDIPCPAAASSHMFYNYFLVDSLKVQGRKTYVLRFHPKKLVTSPTLDGEMQIDAEDFGIRSVHASLSRESNVNWIRHINIDIHNTRDTLGRWFPQEEKLFLDFSVALSDNSPMASFLAHRNMVYGEPAYGADIPEEVLSSKNEVLESPEVPAGDDSFWADARPYKLSEREKGIFSMVERVQKTPLYKWTYGLARMFTVNYIEYRPWGIEYGRWARTFVYNETEGLRLQVGGRTSKYLNRTFRVGGYLAYGLRDMEPKWDATLEWMLGRSLTRKLSFEVKKDFEQFGAGKGVFSAQNMFSSIFARSHMDRQNMTRSLSISYDHEFTPDINANLSLLAKRVWGNPLVSFTDASGVSYDGIGIGINEIHAGLRFSHEERVTRNVFVKTYVFTKYPVLELDYYRGLGGITANDFDYNRFEATLNWNVPSSAIGFGKLHVNAGYIDRSVPYPLLKLHEGNHTFFLDRTAFSCMNYYEFISDRWLSGYYEHNFNGFFLGKIPLVKKLDLREVATVRAAWGTLSPANRDNSPYVLPHQAGTLETPYVEAGVGISNIMRFFRVDAFWRLTHRRPEPGDNFTVNVGVDVEF